MNKNAQIAMSPRKIAEEKYKASRINLVLLIALTVLNLVTLAFGSETMMLFSATVPYYAVLFGIIFADPVFLTVSICVAVICIIAYLICWIASKKNHVWMIVALILFSIDTIALIGLSVLLEDFSGILDLAIHAYIIYQLIVGVSNGGKLKRLPEYVEAEEEAVSETAESAENVSAE